MAFDKVVEMVGLSVITMVQWMAVMMDILVVELTAVVKESLSVVKMVFL